MPSADFSNALGQNKPAAPGRAACGRPVSDRHLLLLFFLSFFLLLFPLSTSSAVGAENELTAKAAFGFSILPSRCRQDLPEANGFFFHVSPLRCERCVIYREGDANASWSALRRISPYSKSPMCFSLNERVSGCFCAGTTRLSSPSTRCFAEITHTSSRDLACSFWNKRH